MVIGNGLIGQRFSSFRDNDRFLLLAAGVSNSKTKDPAAYQRELTLVQQSLAAHPEKIAVYFSTCSIDDPDEVNSIYTWHKRSIESLIQTSANRYYVIRASNVVGATGNPNTVLNYFFYHIQQGINFDLWINACRNLIDIEDLFAITNAVLARPEYMNQVIPIANPVNLPVKTIVTKIEQHLDRRANFIEVEKGGCYPIDLQPIRPLIDELAIQFDDDYLDRLLNTYFKK